jgi:hypothetical protein
MAEGRKGKDREVRLDYAFDRLLATKLQQVYEISFPTEYALLAITLR